MKKLELNLNKRLLITGFENKIDLNKDLNYYQKLNTALSPELKEIKIKAICIGSELSEEIASKYVENFCADMNIPAYRNYSVKPSELEDDHWAHVANDAFESFISAIASQDYYWGINPLGDYSTVIKRHILTGKWDEFERKTFYPEKTLISEILL